MDQQRADKFAGCNGICSDRMDSYKVDRACKVVDVVDDGWMFLEFGETKPGLK